MYLYVDIDMLLVVGVAVPRAVPYLNLRLGFAVLHPAQFLLQLLIFGHHLLQSLVVVLHDDMVCLSQKRAYAC